MSLPSDVFRRLTAGVYVVAAEHDDRVDAFTAAWVMQVSFDPLLVAVSINPGNATWPVIREGRRFVISVLASDQQDVARHFGTMSGRDADKFRGIRTVTTTQGGRALADAAAWLECTVHEVADAGDHVLIIGRVVDGAVLNPKATPLRYDETGSMDGSAALFPRTF